MKNAQSIQEREATRPAPTAEPATPEPVEGTKPDGIRDTIESVIVAFILAFVFRAFVVEAFVIPTGSMAPGLYGMHGQYRCAACQNSFAYGIMETSRLPDGTVARQGTLEQYRDGFSLICPNCGWIELTNRIVSANVVPDSGDRILVLKWPYDIGGSFLGPQRWDTVVFKNPEDGDTNFIKRLLGLPGEVVEIIDGDLYAAPLNAVDEDIKTALGRPPKTPMEGGHPKNRLDKAQSERLAKALRIQRKTRIAQESLWMLHYDHDFMPDPILRRKSPYYNPPRWESEEARNDRGWDPSTPCVRFEPPDREMHWLRLTGKPILDTYGYNNIYSGTTWPQKTSGNLVSDVRLSFVLFPGREQGQTALVLGKGPDVFRATIDADGKVTLEKPLQPGKDGLGGFPNTLRTAYISPLDPERPRTIEFENLDYRVTLRVDGEEVVATTDADYAPNIAQLLETEQLQDVRSPAIVAIGAAGMTLQLRHLAIYRDVYYRSDQIQRETNQRGVSNPYPGYPGWGTSGNPLLLRSGPPDYFCCGDNSPASKDSRLWWDECPMLRDREDGLTYQLGTVPGDQMIGRAFFVYWPGGLRFSRDTPAVIPNVGRMRIIR